MITNLLDKLVEYVPDNKMARICAVYQDGTNLYLALTFEDGTIKAPIGLPHCKFVNERIYSVVFFWKPDQKINAIRIVREYRKLGLKEAKDYVETNYGTTVVKDNLTYEEAEEIRRQIGQMARNVECEIRKEIKES